MCDFDVFISYQWDHKTQIKKLYKQLTEVYNLKCWIDDVELKPNSLTDELAKGISNSKVFLCCITKQYCKSTNCVGEINHARNLNKPMVIIMIERLSMDSLGGIGFIIGSLIRTNAYKFSELFDEPSGELFKQVIAAIKAKLEEWNETNANQSVSNKTTNVDSNEINVVKTLKGHESAVLVLQELTKNRLASASADSSIIIWSLNEFNQIKKLQQHSDYVTCMKILTEERLASGSRDNTIIIWDLSNYHFLALLKGHTESILCLKLLPDGKDLASGSKDYSIRVWNLTNYECVKELYGHISNNEKFIINSKKTIQKQINKILFKKKNDINSSEQANVLNRKENKEKILNNLDEIRIETNSISIESKEINVNETEGHTKAVFCLKNLKCKTRLASGSNDKLIKIWDLINYNCIHTLKGHSSHVVCLKNLPKNRLATGSNDKTIRIWELDKYTCVIVLNGHSAEIQCLQTLSQNRLASGSCDNSIRIWNLNDNNFECVKVIKEHSKFINILRKLNNNRLVSSSNDNTIKVFDTNTYECIETFKEHQRWVSFILVMTNGKISSCSWDGCIKIWKAAKFC